MKSITSVGAAAGGLFSLIVAAGCARPVTVLGTAPVAGAVVTVDHLRTVKPASAVLLHGEMVEKCPVAGCWFMLKDRSGVVRVDTKAAGFVVSSVPVHTQMTVAGTRAPGAEPSVAATGIRF